MGRQKGISLTQSFDLKISRHISNLLDEKTRAAKDTANNTNNNDNNTNNATNNPPPIVLAKHVTASEALRYVLAHDASLARNKRAMIEKAVDRVLKDLRHEELLELGDNVDQQPLSEIDSREQSAVPESDASSSSAAAAGAAAAAAAAVGAAAGSTTSATSPAEQSNTTPSKPLVPVDTSNSKKRTKDNQTTSRPSKRQAKNRDPPNASLAQLGGIDEIVSQLMELVGMPILHPEIYKATGVEPPRGVLLHGPPGCGKTSLANALAGDLKVPFIALSAPSIVSGMSGESEKKVREIFQEAKNLAPCLVFMDEIDAITPKRDGAQREMEKRIVAQLLTCIDELSMEKNNGKPVIIIGATNRPDALDSALRRAGRFDREICLNVPNEIQRMHILKSMTKGLKIDGELDFHQLAKATPGYVGADLKALATAAGICAIKRIFETLSNIDIKPFDSQDGQPEEDIKITEINNEDRMEVDSDNSINATNNDQLTQTHGIAQLNSPANGFANGQAGDITIEEFNRLSTIQKFLKLHPESLTAEQLAPLSITYADFLAALPTIQPTAKREGFATIPDVSWSNVGALSAIRVELHMAVVQPIKRPDLYSKFGITVPGGVLLWGPPGCGKTLLAKAVANESRANFISIKGPELLNKYVGESEKAVRQVFARARASVPCIIFFDELDALVPKRDTSLSESSSRVVNTLLTELDGLNDRHGIFVIGATNRPDMIDPAMLRPGRLDKTLYVELPNADERLEILTTIVKSNKTPIDKLVDLTKVANDERVGYFSGADLAALVREAGVCALKKRFYANIDSLDENVTIESASDDNVHGDNFSANKASGSSDEDGVVTASDFEAALEKVKASVSVSELRKYHNISRKMNGVIGEGA